MKFHLFFTLSALLHLARAIDWGFRQQERKTTLAYGYEVAKQDDFAYGYEVAKQDESCATQTGSNMQTVTYDGFSVEIYPDDGVVDIDQPPRPNGITASPLLKIQKGTCPDSIEFKILQNFKTDSSGGGIITTGDGISHINLLWDKCDNCSPDEECEKYGSNIAAEAESPSDGWNAACCVGGVTTIKVQFNDGQLQTSTTPNFDTCNENFSCGGNGPKEKNAEYHFVVTCDGGGTPSPTPAGNPDTPSPTPAGNPDTPSPTPAGNPPTPQPTGDCVQPDTRFDPNCEWIVPLGSDTKDNDPMQPPENAIIFFNLKRIVENFDRDDDGEDDVSLEFSVNNFFDNYPADIWVEYLSVVEEEGQFVKKQICNSTMDEPYCPQDTIERKNKVFKAACVVPYGTPKEEWWAYTGINVVYRSPGATRIDDQEQEVPCCCRRDSDIDRDDEPGDYDPNQWVYVKYSYAIMCGCPSENERNDLKIDPLANHHHVDRSLAEGEEDEDDGKDDCDEE